MPEGGFLMKKRPSFTKEFKLESVRLMERGDKSTADRAGPTNLNNPLSGFPVYSGHDTPRQYGEPHEQTIPS
jgi:hypothetical protein